MHPVQRVLLITIFTIGTIGGFASGFAHLGAHCAWRQHHRAMYDDRVDDWAHQNPGAVGERQPCQFSGR